MNELKQVVLLEAIKVTGNSVPYPVVNNWAYLLDEINELVELGFLELNEDKYQISFEGKKILLLFKSERKEILSGCDVYKDAVINERNVDARLGLMAFRVRKLNNEEAAKILSSFAYVLRWDDFFSNLRNINNTSLNWQQYLFTAFEKIGDVNRNVWRYLGRDLKDALLTCERLLTPLPKKDLIQITKQERVTCEHECGREDCRICGKF